jgi:alpha-D-xyloside xylohydrolase
VPTPSSRTLARGLLISVGLLVTAGCGSDASGPIAVDDPCGYAKPIDTPSDPQIHTPRWAFEPWISKDISDTADSYAFVRGFQERDIPLGVLVLDSPWETSYNTFVPNPERYPDFDQLIADLKADGIRLVLWTTQMVNVTNFDLEDGGDIYKGPASNYEEGERCGFYVNDSAVYGWWKGSGSAVDFFDADARGWWHRQYDALLDAGVAGFKLDFGDEYITSDVVLTADGEVSKQAYSEEYYRDFYAYGAARVGTENYVTMVRPFDESYGFEGRFFARPEHAPVAWVGDNRRDWVGVNDALDHIFRSAAAGYVVIGSDVGGYLNVDDLDVSIEVPFNGEAFDRWVALGAMTPFMQLHGRANLSPWTVPEDVDRTVEIYRYWATLHHQLVPFFYSLTKAAYAGGDNVLQPIGEQADWAGDYRFLVGQAFLVAPLLEAGGVRDVALPVGASWYDWFDPTADPYAGGTTLPSHDSSDRRHIPLFVREGAIIPLQDANDVTGLGSDAARAHRTVLVYPSSAGSSFELIDDDNQTTTIACSAVGGGANIKLSRAPTTTIVRVRSDTRVASATLDGTPLAGHADRGSFDAAGSGFWSDVANRSTWVKVAASDAPVELVLAP